MKLSEERIGETLILISALISSFFPIITVLSFQTSSPIASLTWSTFFSAIFFSILIISKKKLKELKNIRAVKYALKGTFVIGIVYYLLYFFALRYTSVGNVTIIALFETFSSFLLFNLWGKKYISRTHIFGAMLTLIGSIVILSPNVVHPKIGDILIFIAASIVPFGNYFMLKAREEISSETVLFIRSIVSTVVLFIVAFTTHSQLSIIASERTLIFLVINGIVIFGLTKLMWLESIKRINVVKANALFCSSSAITILLAWPILHSKPQIIQIVALIPIILGILFLGTKRNNKK